MINLTDQEREKFAAYLRQEAEVSDGLAKQAKTIPGVGDAIAKKLGTEAAASMIVAGILTAGESMELRP